MRMNESFERSNLDPGEVLGLRDNKEEVNIIPGEVIGGLRGGKVEYFESVEAQIEELEGEREKNFLHLIDKIADIAPITGLINPLLKIYNNKNIFGNNVEKMSRGEKMAMLGQSFALFVFYAAAVGKMSGHDFPGTLEAGLAGKMGASVVQVGINKDMVLEKISEFSQSHPGYSILLDHFKNAISTLPDKFFHGPLTSLDLQYS